MQENLKMIRDKSEEKIKIALNKEAQKYQKIENDKKLQEELRTIKINKIEEKRRGKLIKRNNELDRWEKEALANNQSFNR